MLAAFQGKGIHNNYLILASYPCSSSVEKRSSCEPAEPADTVTDRLNNLLQNSGPGYTLQLCPSQTYLIQAPLEFGAINQEISTQGYPTDDKRALLVVNGTINPDGTGHSTAIDSSGCVACTGLTLRNIQIDGARRGAPPVNGGANIEMGGEQNVNHTVEFVHSFDPRGWSCLHIAEGSLNCNNALVQNNDIGPCGSDAYQEWADGISMSCNNSIVRNNMIQGPTDGGIVVFGSPGTQVYNNTIWVLNHTLLGGINMVDYDPFNGDFTGTIVTNNTILGGFANSPEEPGEADGTNAADAIIKMGIAVGPRTWFGDKFGNNVSSSGTVINNQFSGAFTYAIAVTSAFNFTIENNVLISNTSFIGAGGPNCSSTDSPPSPAAFIVDPNSIDQMTLQSDFQDIGDGDDLTCVLPPNGGDFWPFGSNPSNTTVPSISSGLSKGAKAGIAVGVILGVLAIGIAAWFIRNWAIKRARKQNLRPR
ncbi:hypothetical protein H0H92_014564 [Tricholoma furcatifolium]|nr:hypothetical protein H0H92_014564 [Tricholoma furcatifolium]